jgi:hypothetical protein
MRKGFQNGAEIHAKTHKKSMPELVSKKIKKIMKIQVFLKGQNLDFERRTLYCCSKTGFARFRPR